MLALAVGAAGWAARTRIGAGVGERILLLAHDLVGQRQVERRPHHRRQPLERRGERRRGRREDRHEQAHVRPEGPRRAEHRLGDKAQQQVTDLADQLTAAQDTLSKAFEGANGTSGMIAAAGVALSTLGTAVTQMKTTLDDLEQSTTDSSDELRKAFASSDECKPVRDQLDKLPGQ